jgi:siroheme synthase-like protein
MAQPQKLALYPLMLTPTFFKGRSALVVGGGAVATRKIKTLLAAGARVKVVAPALSAELDDLRQSGQLEWFEQQWQTGQLQNFPDSMLVFAATSNPAVNRAVAEEARAAGRLVNQADDPAGCDFILPGLVHQGEITLAITTASFNNAEEIEGNPALTAHLRRRLQTLIGPEYGKLARLLRELRPVVKATVPAEKRPVLWQKLVESPALDLLKEDHESDAKNLLENILKDFLKNV